MSIGTRSSFSSCRASSIRRSRRLGPSVAAMNTMPMSMSLLLHRSFLVAEPNRYATATSSCSAKYRSSAFTVWVTAWASVVAGLIVWSWYSSQQRPQRLRLTC